MIRLYLMLCCVFILPGCSVYMAANQPDAKNLDLLVEGTPRHEVLIEFGEPVVSETREGHLYDLFSFTQGYSDNARTGRALLHGTASVLTLGIWEVVGTPTEALLDGADMAYQVKYDEDMAVLEAVRLK